jgi:NADH-quinone oxidoreductase subunit J
VRVRIGAAVVSGLLFLLIGLAMIDEFGNDVIPEAADATRTSEIGQSIFERFVIPFEVVSFVLLAALLGGIVLARRDPSEAESEAIR